MRRARTLLAVPCRVPVPVPPRGRPGFHYADGYAVTLPSGKRVPFMTRRQVRDLCRRHRWKKVIVPALKPWR